MLTTYLNFDGNTEEAFNFYAQALGGKIASISYFRDMTEGTEHMSDEDKNKVMHVALEAPGGMMLMGSDYFDFTGQNPFRAGNNFSLSLHPSSQEQADAWFAALSDGGTVTMPLAKTFWNAYFGMWVDRFGVQWMVNVDL